MDIPKTLEVACRGQVSEATEHKMKSVIGLNEPRQHPRTFNEGGYTLLFSIYLKMH